MLVDQFGRPLSANRNLLLPPYFRRDDITFDGTHATIATTNTPIAGTLQIVTRSGTTTRFMEQSEITYAPASGYTLNYIPANGDIGCVSYFSNYPIIGASTLVASDPYFAYVASLIHFDGTNGSTTFTDQKAVTWSTFYGSPSLSSTQKKFGATSLYSTAGGITSSSSLGAIGTGDYTWEFWLYPTVVTGTAIICLLTNAANPNNPEIYLNSGALTYYAQSGDRITGPSLTINTWQHIALSRNSGSSRLFVNGSQVGSTYADTNSYSSAPMTYMANYTSNFPMAGYLDEARLTIGVGRYPSNFTPPSVAFPNY